MTTFNRLCEKLEAIRATSGKLEKLSLLQSIKDDPELDEVAREYFSIAYDWYRIFNIGVKTLAEPKPKKGAPPADPEQPLFEPTFDGLCGFAAHLERQREPGAQIRAFLAQWEEPLKTWVTRALLKDLDMGVSEKTINKVWPKLINYFEVQLADKAEDLNALFANTIARPEKPTKTQLKKIEALPTHYFLEPKLDGIRAVCHVNPKAGTVKFLSRGGQPLYGTGPAGINDFLLKACTQEVILDGELFGGDWNSTTKVTSRENEDENDPVHVAQLRFFVFDMLTAEEWDNQKCDRGYVERRESIGFECMAQSPDKVVKTVSHAVESPEEILSLYKKYLAKKFEGVMVKDPKGLYTFSRTEAWRKLKVTLSDEFEVVGKYAGKPHSKYEGTLGGLTVKVGDDLTCDVGSGFSDEQRAEYWENPPIGKMIEVEFMEQDKDGMLRFPVFVRIRTDKKVPEQEG